MTTLTPAHLALLHHVAANEVKAMRRTDGVVQVWVDGVFVDDPGLQVLCDARLVTAVPEIAPRAKPVKLTETGREWLATSKGENAA